MGMRVDNIPSYAKRATARVMTIAAVRTGVSEAEFSKRLAAGDAAARETFAAVHAKYGMAIAMEEATK